MALGSMDTDTKDNVVANHTSSMVSQGLATLNSQPATVTVVSAGGATQSKTIVVVPVSNSSGQEPAVKRIKTN